MAHKLALFTSQAADNIAYLKKYRETLTSIFYHFKHSSLRTANLAKIEDVLNDRNLKSKRSMLCDGLHFIVHLKQFFTLGDHL